MNKLDHKPHEVEFLQTHLKETETKLEKEKESLNVLATEVYGVWKQIKKERTENKFNGSGITLKIPVGGKKDSSMVNGNEGRDIDFNIIQGDPDSRRTDESALLSSESSRRKRAKNITVQFNLLVNEQTVCKSREYKMDFPSYEFSVYEVFHI